MEDPGRGRRGAGPGAVADRARSPRHRAGGAGDGQAFVLAPGGDRQHRDQRHRDGLVGHLGQGAQCPGVAPAGRQDARQDQGLYPPRFRRHDFGLRKHGAQQGGRARTRGGRKRLSRAESRIHPLHAFHRLAETAGPRGRHDAEAARGGGRRNRDHDRLPRPSRVDQRGAAVHPCAGAGAAAVRRGTDPAGRRAGHEAGHGQIPGAHCRRRTPGRPARVRRLVPAARDQHRATGPLPCRRFHGSAKDCGDGRYCGRWHRTPQSAGPPRRSRRAAFRHRHAELRDPGGNVGRGALVPRRGPRDRSAGWTATGRFRTSPGLGVEVDEKEIAKHPFKQEVMHAGHAALDDGTIVDW